MKNAALFFAMIFLFSISNAQSKFDNWPELKSFHAVLSQTFHPSEEGNLKPIMERSGELADKAEVLSKSKIPAELNTKEIAGTVETLRTESKTLQEIVSSKGSDEAITKQLTKVHDTFHVIVEKCSHPAGKHDH
jgi:hypothetical protein